MLQNAIFFLFYRQNKDEGKFSVTGATRPATGVEKTDLIDIKTSGSGEEREDNGFDNFSSTTYSLGGFEISHPRKYGSNNQTVDVDLPFSKHKTVLKKLCMTDQWCFSFRHVV